MTSTLLCTLNSIDNPGARGFQRELNGETIAVFLVKKNNEVFAYKNSCPHIRIPLEWTEDQFLTSDKSMIICANHGALFIIETGDCVSGPCNGQSLTPVDYEIIDECVYLKTMP